LLDPGHGRFVEWPADGVLHPAAAVAVRWRGVARGEVVDDVVGGARAVDADPHVGARWVGIWVNVAFRTAR
jgi:hypothetical protein